MLFIGLLCSLLMLFPGGVYGLLGLLIGLPFIFAGLIVTVRHMLDL